MSMDTLTASNIPPFNFEASSANAHALKMLEKSLCLPTRHIVTGVALPSNLFLTFLVHRLVIPGASYPLETSDVTTDTVPNAKALREMMKSISGLCVDDAATYLLAALASRPGDGRRRTLEELISALRTTCKLDNNQRLNAVTKAAKTVQLLIVPPLDWASRDTFFVPSRDLLQAFAQLNAHKVLDAAICAVCVDHPLALESIVKMSEPLETIMRKGIPLVKLSKGSIDAPIVALSEGVLEGQIQGKSGDCTSALHIAESKAPSSLDTPKTALRKAREIILTSSASADAATAGTSNGSRDGLLPGSSSRERGDTMDSQSSHDSSSAQRGVGAGVELEHLTEDPHHLMITADQHMTHGNSSDEPDSDEDGDDDEDDEDEDDEEVDDEDLAESDDEDEDDDDDGDERDGIHFEGGINQGGGRASFNFNMDGVAVSAHMSPTGHRHDDDDDEDEDEDEDDEGEGHHERDDIMGEEDEDGEDDMHNDDDDEEGMDAMFEMAEDEDEDEDGDEILDVTGEDDEFHDLEEDDEGTVEDAEAMAGARGAADMEDPEGDEEGDGDVEGAEELEEEDFTDAEGHFPSAPGRPANLGAHLMRLQQQYNLQGSVRSGLHQQLLQGSSRAGAHIMGMGIRSLSGQSGFNADLIENEEGGLQMRIGEGLPMRIEVLNLLGNRESRSRVRSSGDDRAEMRSFFSEMMPEGMVTSNMNINVRGATAAHLQYNRGGTAPMYQTNYHPRAGRVMAGRSSATGIGSSLPFPVTHPMLRISDPSQARQHQNVSGAGRSNSSGGIFGAIFSAIRERSAAHDDVRQARLNVSTKRRGLGPLVSDRRWGTDIGEVEIVGSRLPALLITAEAALEDHMEPVKERESNYLYGPRHRSSITDSEHELDIMYEDEEQPAGSADEDEDEDEEDDYDADDGIGGSALRCLPDEEECKEEGELEESKEGDEERIFGEPTHLTSDDEDDEEIVDTSLPTTAPTSSSTSTGESASAEEKVDTTSLPESSTESGDVISLNSSNADAEQAKSDADTDAPMDITPISEATEGCASSLAETKADAMDIVDADSTSEAVVAVLEGANGIENASSIPATAGATAAIESNPTEDTAVPTPEVIPASAPVPVPVKMVSFPGVSDEVWAALPFEMQTELLVSVGMQAEADALLDSEITATGVYVCVCVGVCVCYCGPL